MFFQAISGRIDDMAVLTVGPGQQYSTIADAVAASGSGDTINVQAGTYTNDFFYIGHSLTLQAVGGEAVIVATQPGLFGKAAIVEGVPGANVVINGFDISGVAVADGNGAAIRYEGGNLSLTNDYFHNNQEGLLGNADPNGTIAVSHSEFAFNGDGSGFTHNFYAGAIASVTIDDSYFHDAVVGHEIKSRAVSTSVTNSRIFDNNATASYSIDTPNAGNVNISGDVIEQGPNSDNLYIFAYGEEGASNGGSASITGNTIVNDRDGGRGVLAPSGGISLTNNQLWNLPNLGDASASGNVDLASRPSLDTSSLSFISASPPPSGSPPSSGGSPPPEQPPPSAPPPEPPPPTPPPPTLSLDDYHTMVVNDFFAYASGHPDVWSDPTALGALYTEVFSTSVLTSPVPGDLWS
jgi:hypothetical protein